MISELTYLETTFIIIEEYESIENDIDLPNMEVIHNRIYKGIES